MLSVKCFCYCFFPSVAPRLASPPLRSFNAEYAPLRFPRRLLQSWVPPESVHPSLVSRVPKDVVASRFVI